MTKEEKSKVLNHFQKFLASGCEESLFTKALYQHLHLHCGFIAHYNINGFYESRFCGLDNLKITLDGIILSADHCNYDYTDVNSCLAEIASDFYDGLISHYKQIEISNLEREQKMLDNKIKNLKSG
jgi:hypothetical protein